MSFIIYCNLIGCLCDRLSLLKLLIKYGIGNYVLLALFHVTRPTEHRTAYPSRAPGFTLGLLVESVLLMFSVFWRCVVVFIPPPRNEVVGGYTGFTMSVRMSVCPSVHPSVCRQILCHTITWVVFLRIF
jgi:hypothetical protein